MKIVIPGGSGHVGSVLRRHFSDADVVVLTRTPRPDEVFWDGETVGDWAAELEGADAVINLAGRTVNCRYTKDNLGQMMESRILSTKAIGNAIRACKRPPKVWLQASTATIYNHRFDRPNDEYTGILGGSEAEAPRTWNASIEIAKAWEATLDRAETPATRKIAMRSAMTMSRDQGSVFDVLCDLTLKGLFGRLASGRQFVSWVHELDFAHAVRFLMHREDLSGPVNICAPNPLPQAEFAAALRQALGVRLGVSPSKWMIEIGCRVMKTESELVLKSRRVVPTRLLEAGFQFQFPTWPEACIDLLASAIPSR